ECDSGNCFFRSRFVPFEKNKHLTSVDGKITLSAITIRTALEPGDMGYIIHMHGRIYKEEYGYGTGFESYVAKGFSEFYEHYDPEKDGIWIAEHNGGIIGHVLLMH